MTKDRNEDDVAFIRALAELLAANDLTEIDVTREKGDEHVLKVRVARSVAPVMTMPMAAPAAMPAAPAAAPSQQGAAAAALPDDPAQHPGAVTSPMVGTVYLSPEPGADPFVSVGSTVSEGQTVLIVEAMKTMNHIPAPRSGVVRRILVTDATPVEYGAPLIIIE